MIRLAFVRFVSSHTLRSPASRSFWASKLLLRYILFGMKLIIDKLFSQFTSIINLQLKNSTMYKKCDNESSQVLRLHLVLKGARRGETLPF